MTRAARRLLGHNTPRRLCGELSATSKKLGAAVQQTGLPDNRKGHGPISCTQKRTMASSALKRLFDVTLAVVAMAVVAPVLAVAGLVILILDGRPIFFSQERIGRAGIPFRMYKLRTMIPEAEAKLVDLKYRNERTGPLFKLADDPRVTTSGRMLRRFSLDELPQLYNVIRGEMSLVGPRPALPHETQEFDEDFQGFRQQVRPGITGLWQVQSRHAASFEPYESCDIRYVQTRTLRMDLAILLLTLPAVLRDGFRRPVGLSGGRAASGLSVRDPGVPSRGPAA